MRDQKPPYGETQRIEVVRSREMDENARHTDTELILYQRREDGWYVLTSEDDDYWLFASESARDRDVRQLINKKWDYTYNPDPDPLDDRS